MFQNETTSAIAQLFARRWRTGISHLGSQFALETPLLIRVSADCARAPAAVEAVNMGLQNRWTPAKAPNLIASARQAAEEREAIDNPGSLERLMQFFPRGSRVRIPVNVSRAFSPDPTATVIEYGTAREVIFRFPLPLEFGERVRLISQDGSLNTDAEILAVQLSQSETLVAARFSGHVANWIIKA